MAHRAISVDHGYRRSLRDIRHTWTCVFDARRYHHRRKVDILSAVCRVRSDEGRHILHKAISAGRVDKSSRLHICGTSTEVGHVRIDHLLCNPDKLFSAYRARRCFHLCILCTQISRDYARKCKHLCIPYTVIVLAHGYKGSLHHKSYTLFLVDHDRKSSARRTVCTCSSPGHVRTSS